MAQTAEQEASGTEPKGALDGIRVVEYAQHVAGPFCGKILAGFGAEVIKVEPPVSGDIARRRGPFFDNRPDPETSGLFLYLNADKMGVTLNLRTPTGRGLFNRLLEQADILIEDVPPAHLTPLGLDFPHLQALHPQLIVVSVTSFGRTGPHADWKGYEVNDFHAGGEGYLLPNGLSFELFPEREPLMPSGYTANYHAGVGAAIGAMAALYARPLLGHGQHVDVSKQEVQLTLSLQAILRYLNGTLERRANRSFTYGGVLPCKDGYVEVLTLDQHQWEAFVEVMGNPEWAQEERFRDPISRGKHGAEVNQHIREWAKRFTRDELYRMAQRKGVPLGPYYTADDLVHNEHERARGFFASVDHPRTGPLAYPTWPYRFSETPPRLQRGAPLLGEHNRAILCDRLGCEPEELVRLAATGVI